MIKWWDDINKEEACCLLRPHLTLKKSLNILWVVTRGRAPSTHEGILAKSFYEKALKDLRILEVRLEISICS